MNRTKVTGSLDGLSEWVDEICSRLIAGEDLDLDRLGNQSPKQRARLEEWVCVLKELHCLELPGFMPPRSRFCPAEELKSQLGDFQLVRQLGRGGMGVVYEAQQLSIDRRVAVKILHMAALFDGRALLRFRMEVATLANLEHPHIVPIYSAGEDRGIHYFAMKLIQGQSLAVVIRELQSRCHPKAPITGDALLQVVSEKAVATGRSILDLLDSRSAEAKATTSLIKPDSMQPPESESIHEIKNQDYFHYAVRLILQAADALSFAHQRGIIHRDIKPGNLLIDHQGNLYVADFGLARMPTETGITVSGELMGTLRYMSPEQLSRNARIFDHRSDQYSLGATLYELLTLTPMFDTKHRTEFVHQITSVEPKPLRHWNASIPEDLETVVLKAVAQDPADRYSTMADFAKDLRRILDSKPVSAGRPILSRRLKMWTRRHPFAIWDSMAMLIVFLLGSILSACTVMKTGDPSGAAQPIMNLKADESKLLPNFSR